MCYWVFSTIYIVMNIYMGIKLTLRLLFPKGSLTSSESSEVRLSAWRDLHMPMAQVELMARKPSYY